MSWRVLLALACATAFCIGSSRAAAEDETGDVIAAPIAGDQSPEALTPAPDATNLADWIETAIVFSLAAAAILLFVYRRWYRLPRQPNRPQLFSPPIGFALYIAQYLVASIGLTIAVHFFARDVEPEARTFEQTAMISAGAYIAQFIIVGIYAWLMYKAVDDASEERKRPCLWRASLLGAGALLLFVPMAQAMGGIVGAVEQWIRGEPPKLVAHETLQEMLNHPIDGWFYLTAALALIAAPIVEEVFYRGIFQETLRRLEAPPWLAIVATSALFAVMHINNSEPHAVASLFVLSLGFGWIFEKTGRLTACIVMHMLFNAGNLLVAMLVLR